MDVRSVRVTVDQRSCVGCGFCEELLPDVFVLGDYTATVADGAVPKNRLDALEGAARDCPVGAIAITPWSRHASSHDHQEGENEEEDRQVREYQREDGDTGDSHGVEADDSERFQRREHDLTIVRDRADDNEHPRRVSRL